jgi:hypothetical protein
MADTATFTADRVTDGALAQNLLLSAKKRIEIHNGNLLSPINQNAIISGTTYNTADTIYLDRWRLVSGSMVWTSGTGVVLNGVIKQRIEALPAWLYGQAFPFRISIGGTEYYDILDWPTTNTGAAKTVTKNGVTIEIGYESYSAVLCGISSAYTPYVKLITSVSTTINYFNPPADYGEELRKCQRYAIEINPLAYAYSSAGSGYGFNGTTAFIDIPTPVAMRILPTVTTIGNWALVSGSTFIPITGISASYYSSNVITCNVSAASGLTAGVYYKLMASNDTTAKLLLSADL